MTQMVNLELQH